MEVLTGLAIENRSMAVMMNGWTVTDESCLFRNKTVGVFFGEMKATIFGVRSLPSTCSGSGGSHFKNASSSRFTSSECVQFTACGPSLIATSRAPLTSSAVRCPAASMGTILSAAP